MSLTAVEIIATVFIFIALLKLVVVILNKKSWYKGIVKPVYKNSSLSSFVFFILAIILFYYLLQTFTIVDIIAVMALTSLIFGFGFLQHSKELIPVFEKLYNKKFDFWHWVYILFWVLILIWALNSIF